MDDNVIISERMSDEELLKSIDTVLKRGEQKFTTFAEQVNNTLSTIGQGTGMAFGKSLTAQIDKANVKIKELEERIKGLNGKGSTVTSSGTITTPTLNVNTLNESLASEQPVQRLKEMRSEVEKYRQSLKEGSSELKQMDSIYGQIDTRIKTAVASQEAMSLKTAYAMPTNNLTEVETKLKTLRRLQSQLQGKKILNSTDMQRLNTQVDNLSIKLAKMKTAPLTMSDVFKMPESSLNAISEKMKAISTLRNSTTIGSADISKLNQEYQRLSLAQQKALTTGIRLKEHNNSLASSFANLSKRVIFYTGLGALTGFVRQLYSIRGEYEMLERSMGALLGDFAKGSDLFNKIQAQALKSPFTVIDLAGAAKQLVAYNFAEKDVADTTKRVADLASALGVPIERLVYNLGQIKAQGVLNARDARDFANAGFAIIPMLAKLYNETDRFNGQQVTTAEVFQMMTKRMVSYNDVMTVIKQATNEGGMFFNFQAKQAQTLKGQLSNLTDAWNLMLNQMGEANQGVLTGTVAVTRRLLKNWKEIYDIISALVIAYGIYKTSQLVLNATIGKGNTFLTRSIEISKAKQAAEIESAGLTRALTVEEKAYLANRRVVTAADYSAAIAARNLTHSQALMLAAMHANNPAFITAIKNNKLLSKSELALVQSGNRAALTGIVIQNAMKSLGRTITTFFVQNAPMLALTAILSIIGAIYAKMEKHREQLEEIRKSYFELQNSFSKIYVDIDIASKKGDLDTQKQKIQELADLAKEKFNIVFDVDTSRLDAKQVSAKILDMKNAIQEALTTGQVFENSLEESGATKSLQNMGTAANQLYTSLQANQAGMINILQKKEQLKTITNEETKALKILLDTYNKPYNKENLDSLITAYKNLGILQEPAIETTKSVSAGISNVTLNYDKLKKAAEDFGLSDSNIAIKLVGYWDDFQSKQKSAKREFNNFAKDINKGIDFKLLTPEQTGNKVKIGIDKVASKADADSFVKDMLYYWASKIFHVKITPTIQPEGTNIELPEWTKPIQAWLDKNPIALKAKLKVKPNEGETQAQYASRMGTELKNAQKELNIMLASQKRGVNISEAAINQQKQAIELKQLLADAAGYSSASTKAISDESSAIKNEIDLIKTLSSEYDKLTKAGYSNGDSIKLLAREYSKSIGNINATLTKYGLPKFDISQFAGKDVSGQLTYLTQLRDAMKKSGLDKLKPEAFKMVSAQIIKLTVSAKTYDLSQITSGLKDELSDIKDRFELGSEIIANPKTGKLFENIFNIDKNNIIRTTEDAIKEIESSISKSLEAYNKTNNTNLMGLDIVSTNIKQWAEKNKISYNSDFIQGLVDAQKYARGLMKKEAETTIKDWDQLLSKYSDYTYKRNQIQKDAARERLTLVNKFGTEEEKAKALDLSSKIQISDNPEDISRLQNELVDLVTKVTAGNKPAATIATSITNKGAQNTSQVDIDQFKKTEYWITAFSELDNVSTKAIKDMIAKMEEFKDAQKNMSPTEVKEFNKAIENLRDTYVARNPFAALKEGLEEIRTAKDDATSALKEYDDAVAKYGDKSEQAAQAQENLFAANNKYTRSLNKTKTAALSIIDTIGDMTTSFKPLTDALDETGNVAVNSMIAVAKTAIAVAAAIKGVEDSSVILAIIQAALVIVSNIYSVIETSSSKAEENLKALSAQVSYLKDQLDKLNDSLFKDPNQFAAYHATLEARIKLANDNISSIQSALSKLGGSLKTNERDAISNMLTNSYSGLQKAWRDGMHGAWKNAGRNFVSALSAGSISAVKALFNRKAIKNLEYGQKLYNAQLEYSVKLLGIMDSDMGILQKNAEANIANYQMQNEKLMAQIQQSQNDKAKKRDFDKEGKLWDEYYDNLEKMAEVYAKEIKDNYGDIFNDLADDITNAFKDAFDNGINAATTFKEAWQNAIEDLIWNIFKIKTIMPLIQEWMKSFYKSMGLNEDGTVPEGTTPDLDIDTSEAVDLKSGIEDIFDIAQSGYENIKAILSTFGITLGSGSDSASSLQQGIESMSEDTGNAIEAYMNNISGQVFLQNTYLQQINVQLDTQLGVSSQMLLQLRTSYEIQSAIHSLLKGWSSINGQSIRVKLI